MTIRKIECELENRVETGPVQFNDDWPGIFIRGDNAAYFAYTLDQYMRGNQDALSTATVNSLLRLLRECRV